MRATIGGHGKVRFGAQFGLTPLEEVVAILAGHLPPRPFGAQELSEVFDCSRQYIDISTQRSLRKLKKKQELRELEAAI